MLPMVTNKTPIKAPQSKQQHQATPPNVTNV